MKNKIVKKYLVTLFVLLFLSFTAIGFALLGGNSVKNSYITKGVYTVFATDNGDESDTENIKEIKSKVSTNGKYLLLVAAFDESILNQEALYYIGYNYTLNGERIDTTQLDGAKTSTYYEGVTLTTSAGESTAYAQDIYGNAEYEGYTLIVFEIEFETSYEQEQHALENIIAFINEVEPDGEGGYDVVKSYNSPLSKDYSGYRLLNGGFEDGMTGWTKVGDIGDVDTATNYWINDPENANGFEFGMDGAKMFSAYAPGASEGAVGTLTSSAFKVGGSGYITYKVGAMKDGNYVYIDIVEQSTGIILARYTNGLWQERTNDIKSGCTLVPYRANLSAFIGKTVYIRISDNADSNYGLFFVDSFETYYAYAPEDFNDATAVSYQAPATVYDIMNGSFEIGEAGWWNQGGIGHVTNADAFFSGVAYGKVGDHLFSGVEDFQAGNGREGNRGALISSVFEIGGTGYISFMLGGGGNELCYIQIVDAVTGELLARYHQQAMQDAVLIQYVANLSAYIGRTVRLQVVDQAENAWGCVSFDNVITYYASTESLPAGITANDIKGDLTYSIANGSFETGNIDGWTMHITEAGGQNTLGWVLDREIDAGWYAKNDDTKDGNFLFTFATPDDVNCENSKGTLQSSTFSLKQGAFVSFKFGAAGNAQNHDVFIELCRADGSVIARFFNDAPGKVNTRMNSYYYQYNGVEVNCFFRVVDNSTGDYGCLVLDDFRVNLDSAPDGYIPACM